LEVQEAIRTRRSIRRYKDTGVDDEILEQVLEAARWAPSWANTQVWRFIVVRDEATRAELADTLTPMNPAINAVKNAPITIVACAELKRSGCYRGEPITEKGDSWYMFDVGLAMQNLTLAAHALGLGTVHIGAFNASKAGEILGVPEGFCVVEMTPLGYPDHEARTPPRKELSEIVFHERFGGR
jgi:nitroreductase